MIKETDWQILEGMLDRHLWLLLRQSIYLVERESRQPMDRQICDYGFLVFTAAIVYEGFLKRFFYMLGLISASHLRSDNFRIGKALNPDLPERYRDNGYVYSEVAALCTPIVAAQLWNAWKRGRNQIFHYDFVGKQNISLKEAEQRIMEFIEAMLSAARCEREVKPEDY